VVQERQDTLLLSCLASVTKGAHALAEVCLVFGRFMEPLTIALRGWFQMSRKLELTTDKKGKGLESFPGYP
jgi:hypothetical protein